MIRVVEVEEGWLALGILYKARGGMFRRGWEWLPGNGCTGCYRTRRREVAERLAQELHKPIECEKGVA